MDIFFCVKLRVGGVHVEKKKYYINIGDGEISQLKHHNNAQFTIHATDEEVRWLRTKFDNMHNASVDSYFRAHIPIVQYHNDKPNDDYDANMAEVYRVLYELGDDEAKQHIRHLNILPGIEE